MMLLFKVKGLFFRRSFISCIALPLLILLGSSTLVASENTRDPSAIATYVFEGGEGLHDNVPVTFGAVFAPGDVPAGNSVGVTDRSGNHLPTQIDPKARHPDGSLRQAVITVVFPHLGSGDDVVAKLVRAPVSSGALSGTDSLPKDFDAEVVLTSNGQELYASARDLLSRTKPELWLNGPQVTEWWVSGAPRNAQGIPDPHLSVRFGLRSYGPGRPLRVEVDVENCWTWIPHRGTQFYDAEVKIGGQVVFSNPGMKQPAQTRWRKLLWVGTPVDAYVKPDLTYLKKTRVIPNYDETLPGLAASIERMYARFAVSNRDVMGTGILTSYMPTTGGRWDIALFPGWTVDYLLTWDKRAYEMTMMSGDQSGSFASHYRNEKTGRPSTSEEFPNLSTHSNYVGRPGNLELPNTGGYRDPNVPQAAHEPSLDFIPYLLTGDRFYLEELEFWSQWNSWGTAPENRGFKDGLVMWDEVRAQAWSLRTLAQAAYIAPDSDPLKQTLLRELKANLAKYDGKYVDGPPANVLHIIAGPSPGLNEYSPWMDDYLTSALGYIVGLGFDFAKPFALWKADYAVQRMINPEYCWILATPYRMLVPYPDTNVGREWSDALSNTFAFATKKEMPPGLECGGDEMASALRLTEAGEMMGNAGSGGGYPANFQPALAAAVDLGVPGADAAWAKFQARAVKPAAGFDPQWSILPLPK